MKDFKIFFVICVSIMLLGCASSAKIEGMAYENEYGLKFLFDKRLHENVVVNDVSGGQITNPLWTSEISNEEFKLALKLSLKTQHLYSASGRYRLDAQLLEVKQPVFGLSFTVITKVKYTILDNRYGKVVLDKVVVADYTATMGDSFWGIKRLRLANEGSAKNNIEKLIRSLSIKQVEAGKLSL